MHIFWLHNGIHSQTWQQCSKEFATVAFSFLHYLLSQKQRQSQDPQTGTLRAWGLIIPF